MPSIREQAEELFRTYYEPVFHFFLRRGIPREESHDLAQETFCRVLRGLGDFRREAGEGTWVFSIARNLWLNRQRDRLRQKRGRPEVSLSDTFSEDQQVPEQRAVLGIADDPGPEVRLIEDEQKKRLNAALQELPPQRRRCLVLRLQNLKYREIADVLGISLQAVRSHLFLARKQIVELLGDEVVVNAEL